MESIISALNPFKSSSFFGGTRTILLVLSASVFVYATGHLLFGTARVIEAAKKDLPDSITEEIETSTSENITMENSTNI